MYHNGRVPLVRSVSYKHWHFINQPSDARIEVFLYKMTCCTNVLQVTFINGKHFLRFHTGIEIRVGVGRTIKWEHEPAQRVFPRYFACLQTSTSVSITYRNTGGNVFYIFYKITRRKLKRGNKPSLSNCVNSPYCSWWRMRWRRPFYDSNAIIEILNTAFSQSNLAFCKCYLINIKYLIDFVTWYCV